MSHRAFPANLAAQLRALFFPEQDHRSDRGSADPTPDQSRPAGDGSVVGSSDGSPSASPDAAIEISSDEIRTGDSTQPASNQQSPASGRAAGPDPPPTLSDYVVAIVLLLANIVSGTVFFLLGTFKNPKPTKRVIDGLYFTIVTITTVGLGDITPVGSCSMMGTVLLGVSGTLCLIRTGNLGAAFVMIRMKKLAAKYTFFHFLLDDDDSVKHRYKVILFCASMLLCIVSGMIGIHHTEGIDWPTSLYQAAIISLTIGYGDCTFKTFWGRAFGSIWILISHTIVNLAFSSLADLIFSSLKVMLSRIFTRVRRPRGPRQLSLLN